MPPSRLNLRRIQNRQARSPQPEATNAQIARIDALTATGRTNWFALLAYLAFVTVTTLGVEDVDFFVDSRQTQLPIVGVSIPTFSFFIFAPVLGAALYVYLHLHIRKVTEALGKPPLGPPPLVGETPIETRIKPWLLNDFVLRQRRDGAVPARPLDTLSWLTTWALVWFAGPFVLGLMWWRGWPAHNLLMSAVNALSLMVAIYAGALSWTKMRSDTGRRTTPGVIFTTAMCGLLCLPVAWLTAANSKGIAEWVIAYDKDADEHTRTWAERLEAWVREMADDPERTIYDKIVIWSWKNGTELTQLDSPELYNARLSVLPPEHADLDTARHRYRAQWCQRNGLPPAICGGDSINSDDAARALLQSRQAWCAETKLSDCRAYFIALEDDFTEREWPEFRSAMIAAIVKPNLSQKDLRAARLDVSELSGIDLSSSNLKGANLVGAKMEEAALSNAELKWAGLSFADLRGANLIGASMEGADLRNAKMKRTILLEANMERTDLRWAELNRAELAWVSINDAFLAFAEMKGANFYKAQMKGANLFGATMVGTQLNGADLEGANLDLSALIGTAEKPISLEETNLSKATNNGGALRYVDLRLAIFDANTNFRNSFGDATAILPDTIERPCQWATERLSDAEFYSYWKGWIATLLRSGPSGNSADVELEEIWLEVAPEEWRETTPWPTPIGCSPHE